MSGIFKINSVVVYPDPIFTYKHPIFTYKLKKHKIIFKKVIILFLKDHMTTLILELVIFSNLSFFFQLNFGIFTFFGPQKISEFS